MIHSSFSLLFVCLCLSVAKVNSQATCTDAQNCTRTPLNPANSAQYVQCISNRCVCVGSNNCFSQNSTAVVALDSCVLDTTCYNFNALGVCENTARNWVTALLLQVFVGGVGAANFYIGRDDFGGAQLFLFLATIIFPFFLCCASCCVTVSFNLGGENSACGFICGISVVIAIILIIIIVLVCAICMSLWYTADVIIFATNQRTDLNGCRLFQPF